MSGQDNGYNGQSGADMWREYKARYGEDEARGICNRYLDMQVRSTDPEELRICKELYAAMQGDVAARPEQRNADSVRFYHVHLLEENTLFCSNRIDPETVPPHLHVYEIGYSRYEDEPDRLAKSISDGFLGTVITEHPFAMSDEAVVFEDGLDFFYDSDNMENTFELKYFFPEPKKNEMTFEYGGYHFTPVRQFRKGEVDKPLAGDSRPWKRDEQYAMRNMHTDRAVDLPEYNYDAFYAAATDKDCDIFRCEETGRLYVPGANELFGYNESKQRNRTAKASVMGALERAKREPPAPAAERKPGPGRKGEER